ncbi:FAD-dependent oxidoreductase [Paenibacillus sp. GCM10012303]|jgi:hypothetical protein|uniref:FAD-dependent oxidoreductase n=1 Tax=Paenibacillus sp. GCM10012303 TaxID=3317340 RepID=UPI00360AEC77
MKLLQWINKQSVATAVDQPRFDRTYDAIVVGLGTAGAVAAIAAARSGLSTLGIERQTSMGGTGTNGHVAYYYFGAKGGLYEQLDERAALLEKEGCFTDGAGVEAKKLALEEAALQAGVTIRYECTAIGLYMKGGTIAGIRWIGPDGVQEAGCRVVIDCSGDAEIAVMAGCAARFGRDSDGTTHAYSNVVSLLRNGRVKSFYTDSGYVDHTDTAELTEALLASATLPTHLKHTYGEGDRLLKVAPQLGIREGRLINGDPTLTFERFVRGEWTSEPLFYAYANLDNHAKDLALESDLQQEWSVVSGLWSLRIAVPVPLEALIPQGTTNLLVAGRSLAVDHDLASCIRMKRDMQKCGEIAAKAAYLAVRDNIPVREVSYAELRRLLDETGCASEAPDTVEWLTEPDAIRSGLGSETPGIAIWSARRQGGSMIGPLREWCAQKQDGHLRKHSALALALLGDAGAIPALREMVLERDAFLSGTSHMYSQFRAHAAIYLLGKLGDAKIVPELERIVAEPGSREPEESWIRNKFIVSADDYRFQYVSYALLALLRIGSRHASVRERIAAFVRREVLDESFQARFYLNSVPEYELPHLATAQLQRLTREQLASW